MLIDIRCKHCRRLHCQVSVGFFGVVVFICAKCDKKQTVSLAAILTETSPESATIPPPAQESTRT